MKYDNIEKNKFNQLNEYYIDYSREYDFIISGGLGPFDSNKIPLVDYKKRYLNSGIKVDKKIEEYIFYTPVTLTIYGFGLIDVFKKTSDPEILQKIQNISDWLVDNIVPIDAEAGIWEHNFKIPFKAGIEPPYPSAIAQAQAISFLLRAYQICPKDIYIDTVKKAFQSFNVPISMGGVQVIDNKYLWLEEWPSKPPSHVLNGFMFCILAIYDYYKFFNCNDAGKLLNYSLVTLRENLPKYDSGYWTRYDLLRGLIVSENYHSLHIKLLSEISKISNDDFNVTVERWKNYTYSNKYIRRLRALIDNFYNCAEWREEKLRMIFYKIFKYQL